MARGLIIGAVALLVILGGVFFYIFSNLGDLLEAAIEEYGPEMTQSDVAVDDVELSPQNGEGEIKGFTVDNPDGYETEEAVSVGSIALAVDPGSLTENVIIIRKLHVTQPSVTVEIAEDGSTNLEHIQKNVMEYVENLQKQMAGEGSGGDGTDKAEPAGEEQKFILEDFRLTDGEVTVHSKFLNLGEISSDLPNISMQNIGKSEGGLTGGELAAVLVKKIQGSAMNVVQGLNIGDVNKLLEGGVEALSQQGMENLGKSVEEGLGGAAGEAGEALKGLFGN